MTGVKVQSAPRWSILRRFEMTVAALIFALVVAYFWSDIFIVIYPGELGVRYSRLSGTETDKYYTEGLNIIFPWEIMYRYDMRLHKEDVTVKILAVSGMVVTVNATVHFRPETSTLALLHQRFGPDYDTKIVEPLVVSSLREILGNATPDSIYHTDVHVLQDSALAEIRREGRSMYVAFENIDIRSIALPDAINAEIEDKMGQEQNMLAYEYRIKSERLEAERRIIEAEGRDKFYRTLGLKTASDILKWEGIQATAKIAASENAKVVVVGSGPGGLPIILGSDK